MPNKLLFSLVIGWILLVTNCLAQETMTFTTYYPSPYGVYKNLRIYPNDDNIPGMGCANEGELYYDASDHQLQICTGSPLTWTPVITGGGGGGTGLWALTPTNPNNIYNLNSGNVGVGTATPGAKLDVWNPSGNSLTLVGRFRNLNNAANNNGLLVSVARTASDTYGLAVQSGGANRLYVRSDGNVGIGTSSPASMLQVAGGVQVGADNNAATACPASKAGTIRYKNNKIEYCNGSVWKDVNTPTTTFAVCADADHSTWCTMGSINQCSCVGGTLVSKVQSSCTATSDTGSCSANSGICMGGPDYGTCCVCRP